MNKIVFKWLKAKVALVAAGGPALAQVKKKTASKPHILVILSNESGNWNICHNNRCMMGYCQHNIDRFAKEGSLKPGIKITRQMKSRGYGTGKHPGLTTKSY